MRLSWKHWQLLTFISYPAGLNHSKRKIEKADIWTAATPTNIQEAASKGSEKQLRKISK